MPPELFWDQERLRSVGIDKNRVEWPLRGWSAASFEAALPISAGAPALEVVPIPLLCKGMVSIKDGNLIGVV